MEGGAGGWRDGVEVEGKGKRLRGVGVEGGGGER